MIMFDEVSELFEGSHDVELSAGEALFRKDDSVQSVFLVTSGRIDLVRYTKNGQHLILSRSHSGAVVAEGSAYAARYHCDGVARTRSSLRAMAVSDFQNALERRPDIARLWAAGLARALQAARMQSEIRTLKTVAERLDMWLADNPALPPKGQRQDLANILGVSREALYRELSRRRTR